MSNEDMIKLLEIQYSEWKEELGDRFPSFLNHVLVARLIESQKEIEYLRKITFSEMVR